MRMGVAFFLDSKAWNIFKRRDYYENECKEVLGLVLAGVLAAGSLTACGGGGTAATTADTKAEATTAAGDAKAEAMPQQIPRGRTAERKRRCAWLWNARMLLTTGHSLMIPMARWLLRTAMNLLTDMMS